MWGKIFYDLETASAAELELEPENPELNWLRNCRNYEFRLRSRLRILTILSEPWRNFTEKSQVKEDRFQCYLIKLSVIKKKSKGRKNVRVGARAGARAVIRIYGSAKTELKEIFMAPEQSACEVRCIQQSKVSNYLSCKSKVYAVWPTVK